MTKKKQKISPIELSQEDINRLEQQKKDIEYLKKILYNGLRIPKEFFDDNNDTN